MQMDVFNSKMESVVKLATNSEARKLKRLVEGFMEMQSLMTMMSTKDLDGGKEEDEEEEEEEEDEMKEEEDFIFVINFAASK